MIITIIIRGIMGQVFLIMVIKMMILGIIRTGIIVRMGAVINQGVRTIKVTNKAIKTTSVIRTIKEETNNKTIKKQRIIIIITSLVQ